MIDKIASARLELAAATYAHHCAELESPEQLGLLLKATVETGWPPGEYDRGAQEFFRDKLQEGGETVTGWYCWYALTKETKQSPSRIVGAGGFLGLPNDRGEVEIGFSIMPSWRGKGYATEFVRALVTWAFKDGRVKRIIARAKPENPASRKVLQKAGFVKSSGASIEEYQTFELQRQQL